MKFYRKILFPFVPVYYAVTWLRNKLYDIGIKKSVAFNFPVICVGNLSVGGTGKTPMVEYLIAMLEQDYKVATLSRGYKRITNGFQLAKDSDTAETLGDEPFQFYSKFKNHIYVAVDANRVNGIKTLQKLDNPPEIILLDDAFQHRKVKAGFNILLTTYADLYTNDYVLPAGNLREPASGAKRAQIIVITKCPKELSESKKEQITKELNPEAYQSVFFSSVTYSNVLKSVDGVKPIEDLKTFTLVTGIANAQPLVDYLTERRLVFEHLNYQDHHAFSNRDIAELNKKNIIVTTEKDFMRLQKHQSLKDKLLYLPIKATIDNASGFEAIVKKFVVSKR